MRIPEGILSEGRGGAADGRPLRGTGVDADADASLHAFVHHTLDEVDVVGGGSGPVRGTLDIDPEHAELGSGAQTLLRSGGLVLGGKGNTTTGQVVNGSIHLTSRVAAFVARENVTIHIAHSAY